MKYVIKDEKIGNQKIKYKIKKDCRDDDDEEIKIEKNNKSQQEKTDFKAKNGEIVYRDS